MRGKNVGKKHHNRRKKATAGPAAKGSYRDHAISTDSDSQDGQIIARFLLPQSPVLLRPISDGFVMPVHLKSNATPHGQYIIKQCK